MSILQAKNRKTSLSQSLQSKGQAFFPRLITVLTTILLATYLHLDVQGKEINIEPEIGFFSKEDRPEQKQNNEISVEDKKLFPQIVLNPLSSETSDVCVTTDDALGESATSDGPSISETQIFPVDRGLVKTLLEEFKRIGQSEPVAFGDYPMPDGSTSAVELQSFPLWTANAEITVFSSKESLETGRPGKFTQLLGVGLEDPKIAVQLRETDEGFTGVVIHNGVYYTHSLIDLETEPQVTFNENGLVADPENSPEVSVEEYILKLDKPNVIFSHEDIMSNFCCVGGPGGRSVKFFDLAIETDDEFFARFQNLYAIQREIENIISGVNAIYYRDTGIIFRLRWLGMFTNSPTLPDWYNGSNSGGVVRELRDYWNMDTIRQSKTRDAALLFSGKFLGGSQIFFPWECNGGGRDGEWCIQGSTQPWSSCPDSGSCDWVGEPLCETDKSYAVIQHNPTRAVRNIVNTAHEIGHLFGVEHTHCTNPPIDRCISGALSLRGTPCFQGTPMGISGAATIMSYCSALWPDTYDQALEFHPISKQVITDAADKMICAKSATVVELSNGVPVTNLSSTSAFGYHYFMINVPISARDFRIETYDGSGALKLYARHGTLPTTWGTEISDTPGTTHQTITKSVPNHGPWYILIIGDPNSAFMNISLSASYN